MIFYHPRDGDLPRDVDCLRDGDHHRYDDHLRDVSHHWDHLEDFDPGPLVVPNFGTMSLIRDIWLKCPYFVPNCE